MLNRVSLYGVYAVFVHYDLVIEETVRSIWVVGSFGDLGRAVRLGGGVGGAERGVIL